MVSTLFNLCGRAKVATNNKANMANILDILFIYLINLLIMISKNLVYKRFLF
jgi:hypothetical protein